MDERTIHRLNDIADAIGQIEALLEHQTFADLMGNRVVRAAFERFLEIVSEASRHIPGRMMAEAPEIPWRRVHDIGNHLRHAYNRVDMQILWDIYATGELARLSDAVARFIASMRPGETPGA